MNRPIVVGASALGLLVLGAAIGRTTAPTKVVEREKIVTRTVEVAAKQTEEASDRALALDTQSSARLHIRTVHRPDGTIQSDVTRVVAAETRGKEAQSETHKEAEIRYVDRWKEKETIKLVERAQSQWEAGVLAGYALGGGPSYGGFFERRIVGGIKAGVFITTSKTFGAMIGLEW